MRNRLPRNLTGLMLALALCAAPFAPAQAFEFKTPEFIEAAVEPMEIGFDAVLVRPLTFSTLIIGGVMFVPAVILSGPNLATTYEEAVEIFITIPYESTFERPLGDF